MPNRSPVTPPASAALLKLCSRHTAVKSAGQSLSYRQLDETSNQVAHCLLATNGAPGAPIAFMMDQGASSIGAILGILKAGHIYVALEPTLPPSELARIVADCRPGLILTNAKYFQRARQVLPDGCVDVDAIDAEIPTAGVGLSISPDQTAYIFYTSGSTGVPKGVYDNHRNVLHNIMRYTNNLNIGPHDRLSLIQSAAFSGTVSSLFAAVLNGACVHPFDLQGQGIERLADWVAGERLTIFHSVPMIFERMLATPRRFDDLRVIRLEGDQTHPRHIQAFRDRFGPHCMLVNGLGATETGIVRQYFVTPQTTLPGNAVPIGHPVEDMEIRLLDENGQPVAHGVEGEISIASPYLAVGYWNHPELTAKAFQDDPEQPGYRIYRSGDRGRMLLGDCLLYLGRQDFRAKIRGQRIEITEIEDQLCSLSTVEQALVTVREDRPGRQQLVAYIVGATGVTPPTVTALRRAVQKTLPEIMVPGRYVFCDELPMDRNRKVLRRALPAPDDGRPALDVPFVPAQTEQQQRLVACFEEVLGISPIGLDDGFFDLGGDSLLATALILLIEDKLETTCPTDFLATSSSITGLEKLLTADQPNNCAVTLQAQGTAAPLFCLHDYSGHAMIYRHLARLMAPDRPVIGLQWGSLPNAGDPNMTVEEMARTYVGEVRRIQPEGAYHLCGNCFGGVVAFEVAQQLRAAGKEVALLGLIDTGFPAGPVRRFIDKLAPARRLRRISRMPWGEKRHYVTTRCHGLLRWIGTALRRRRPSYMARAATPSDRQNKPRRLGPVDANHLSVARYKPRPYDGAASVFCLGNPGNRLGWRRVMKQGVEFVQLPFDGGVDRDATPHPIMHPYVTDLALELRRRLTK